MLEVRDLRKVYGSLEALRGVAFSVAEGDIVGFLGPNGAGKSTTMRIVTGYLPASSGSVHVDGLDVLTHSLEVRRRIGYLPEHTPLYKDMRVVEYLRFRAHLKGVPRRERSARVDEVVERAALEDRRRQIISTLSKGYRQRVGIADALLGRPRLLILDEPTIGLDPNQVRQVRGLIRELAAEQTVILSTHILAEVESICNKVVVVHKGLTVAEDRIDALIDAHDPRAVALELSEPRPGFAAELAGLDEVAQVEERSPTSWRITPKDREDLRPALAQRCIAEAWPLLELRREKVSLEDVFTTLTREAEASQEAA